ncbi:hypothetical protein [Devosia salina]|uniref:Uncharacterized protein n=1 Tax=Devosia salina TaxID=2860336 RepID=A0ABX8W9N2_9HYPH|nr:hypothetical protein [Devosia salina]QYO75674.1 hypothetical protein K1X15_13655 [Devosia salina]
MTEFTATQIAADIYKGMDANRKHNGGSFRTWDSDPMIAACDAIACYKEGAKYEDDLVDNDLHNEVVDELIEMIEDEMELEYDPDLMAEGVYDFKPLNFTHVAITWDDGLAYVAEAKTAAEALDAMRKDVSPDTVTDGLNFYQVTTYEAGRIYEMTDFNRLIRAADERQISD